MKRTWTILLAACGFTDSEGDIRTAEESVALVSSSRYQQDLEALAVPRPAGSEGWQAAQDRCRTTLEGLGFVVELQDYGSGENVIGRLPGEAASPRQVLVSAHYDSVNDCSGADDNASGVAGALEMARVMSGARWNNDLIVACWDEEELGLVGSREYAERAAVRDQDLVVAVALEMIGKRSTEPDSQTLPMGFNLFFPEVTAAVEANDNRGDFIASIHDRKASDFHASLVDFAPESLPVVGVELTRSQSTDPLFGDLQRSDHAPFWEAGFPAMMITDTAEFRNPNYHCRADEDAVADLDAEFSTDVLRALAGAVATALEPVAE